MEPISENTYLRLNMSLLEDHYSPGEVAQLFSEVSQAEAVKMILLIRQLNPDRAGYTAEDMYELTVKKILSGDRKWRRDVKRATFVRNAARSIIWSETKKSQDALSQATAIEDIDGIAEMDLTADLRNDEKAIKSTVKDLFDMFKDDKTITCILLHLMKDFKASKIKELCKLTEQTYQAARRRLKRNVFKKFPTGIDYWRESQ